MYLNVKNNYFFIILYLLFFSTNIVHSSISIIQAFQSFMHFFQSSISFFQAQIINFSWNTLINNFNICVAQLQYHRKFAHKVHVHMYICTWVYCTVHQYTQRPTDFNTLNYFALEVARGSCSNKNSNFLHIFTEFFSLPCAFFMFKWVFFSK